MKLLEKPKENHEPVNMRKKFRTPRILQKNKIEGYRQEMVEKGLMTDLENQTFLEPETLERMKVINGHIGDLKKLFKETKGKVSSKHSN